MIIIEKCENHQLYIALINHVYINAAIKITQHGTTDRININGGVRQSDVISPKLFTIELEDVFKNLQWEQRGVMIQGENLTNLRLADDIAIFVGIVPDLQNN